MPTTIENLKNHTDWKAWPKVWLTKWTNLLNFQSGKLTRLNVEFNNQVLAGGGIVKYNSDDYYFISIVFSFSVNKYFGNTLR